VYVMCCATQALARKYETRAGFVVYMPENGETVVLPFEESRSIKVIGELVRCLQYSSACWRCGSSCVPFRVSLCVQTLLWASFV
jgi:hypothetical protein